MENKKYIEMIILLVEIILLSGLAMVTFNYHSWSLTYYFICLAIFLTIIWRVYNYGNKKNE